MTTDTIAADRAAALSPEQLRQFTGSEHWYRHALVRTILFTDGAHYVAEKGGAYWLLDEIALTQRHDKRVAHQDFQVWTLAVKPDRSATLSCGDGNGRTVYEKAIPWTDFPVERVELWVANNTIYLPSEH